MKPEYDQWAENLLQEIYYTPESFRVELIKSHLIKAVQRGYTDGLDNGWWKEQDLTAAKQVVKNLKREFPNGMVQCSHNYFGSTSCIKCGEVG